MRNVITWIEETIDLMDEGDGDCDEDLEEAFSEQNFLNKER